MDNPGEYQSPAFDEFEKQVDHIREIIDLKHSRGVILLELNSFLSKLYLNSNSLYLEAIFSEFFPVYLKLLGFYTTLGEPPRRTRLIIKNASKLYLTGGRSFREPELAKQIKRLRTELKAQILMLNSNSKMSSSSTPLFPVIETTDNKSGLIYLETLEVKLTPSRQETRFIVHPTYRDEDSIMLKQLKTSFDVAVKVVQTGNNKLPPFFEAQIFFRNGLGLYAGNSFGSFLTLLFIRELRHITNPNLIIDIAPGLTFTGAVDSEGKLLAVGRENIIRKTRAVFFSDSSRFIVPKSDEQLAVATVEKLQQKWQNRHLEIVGIKDVSEIINRRDIFLVSRKPIKQRFKEALIKYRYASVLLIPIIVLLGFFYVREFDNNPIAFELEGTNLNIKNRYGRVLWSWSVHPNVPWSLNNQELRTRIRIIDVDDDGVNEIISSGDINEYSNFRVYYSLFCYDQNKEVLWTFALGDTVSSPKEKNIPAEYGHQLFDTVTIGGVKSLLTYSNSSPTYPAALYLLDIKTGKRIGSTLWNAGFIYQIALVDVNDDQKDDLIFLASDNGFGYQKIVAVEFPLQEGMLPTRADYLLYGKKIIDPIFEIKLPVTDYISKMTDKRSDFFPGRSCTVDKMVKIGFYSRYSHDIRAAMYKLILNSKTMEVDYFIEGTYKNLRDSLVNLGKLPLPYTDTKEYTDILKNGVRYKLNGNWVTYKEYTKARQYGAINPIK